MFHLRTYLFAPRLFYTSLAEPGQKLLFFWMDRFFHQIFPPVLFGRGHNCNHLSADDDGCWFLRVPVFPPVVFVWMCLLDSHKTLLGRGWSEVERWKSSLRCWPACSPACHCQSRSLCLSTPPEWYSSFLDIWMTSSDLFGQITRYWWQWSREMWNWWNGELTPPFPQTDLELSTVFPPQMWRVRRYKGWKVNCF